MNAAFAILAFSLLLTLGLRLKSLLLRPARTY
jgi:hypothetical protein